MRHAAPTRRELGIRTAFEFTDDGYEGWQLHPGDTGGSFLEIDVQPPGETGWDTEPFEPELFDRDPFHGGR